MPPLGPRAQPKPTKKVRNAKPKPKAAPAPSDVRSSGGDYGTKQAKQFKRTPEYKRSVRRTYTEQPVKRRQQILEHSNVGDERTVIVREHKRRIRRRKEVAKSQAQHDVVTNKDLEKAKAFNKAHPVIARKKVQTAGPNISTGWISRWSSAANKVVPPKKATTTAGKVIETAGKVFVNAQKNALEYPTSVVPTAAHIAEPALKHPTQPKAYAEAGKRAGEAAISLPKELYKHPGKTLVSDPLGVALLVNPAGKVPIRTGRAIQRRIPGPTQKGGKVLAPVRKVVGEAPKAKMAELPGTQLVVRRPVVKGYTGNIKKKLKPTPEHITNADIRRRVNEDAAYIEAKVRHKGSQLARQVYHVERKKGVSRKEARLTASQLALKEQQKIRRQVEKKMRADYALSEKPFTGSRKAVKPIEFKSEKQAQVAADNAKIGDVEFQPTRVGKKWIVEPKVKVEQYKQHTESLGQSHFEKTVRGYNTLWRRNVLALHPTWYVGNALEAAVRAAIHGVGPASFYRGYKIAGHEGVTIPHIIPKVGGKRILPRYAGMLEQSSKQAAGEASARIYGGGHLAMQVKVDKGLDALMKEKRSPATKPKEVARRIAEGYEGFTDFTMGTLSGRLESAFQKGMMGKALSKDPIMNGHMVKVSKAAMEDAVKGMRETPNMVELGRVVDTMYGKYGKFSPGTRRWIANYTPFISWTGNALDFLYRVLPRDHPVLTAAVAAAQPYVDEWLKDKGLRKFARGAVPRFLQGAVPTPSGLARYPTRYTPFAVAAQYPNNIGQLFIPQWMNAINVLANEQNWKGQKLKNPDGTPLNDVDLTIAALLTLYEGAIPASQMISGASDKHDKGERNVLKLVKPKPAGEIASGLNPFRKVQKKQATTSGKAPSLFGSGTSSKPSLFPSSGGGNSLFK